MGNLVNGKYVSSYEGDQIDEAIGLVRLKSEHITKLPQDTTSELNLKVNKSDIVSTVSDATDKVASPAGVKAIVDDNLTAPMTQEAYDAIEYKQNKYYFIYEED